MHVFSNTVSTWTPEIWRGFGNMNSTPKPLSLLSRLMYLAILTLITAGRTLYELSMTRIYQLAPLEKTAYIQEVCKRL